MPRHITQSINIFTKGLFQFYAHACMHLCVEKVGERMFMCVHFVAK